MPNRIFIVDHHPVVREGYKRVIGRESDMVVCGDTSSAERAFPLIADLRPDAVLTGLSLPGVNGIELVKRLTAIGACRAVLVVSSRDEALYAERAVAAGALGYIMKHESTECIVDALRRVLEGRLALSESLREQRSPARTPPASVGVPGGGLPSVGTLTDREIEVFEHLGRGRTTHQVAQRLGLSLKTVESHRANIRRKLGLRHAPELVQRAVLWAERLRETAGGEA